MIVFNSCNPSEFLPTTVCGVWCRWWAQPSAPQCVRSSLSRPVSWWTAQWKPASRLAARPATMASCWSKSGQQLVWWARPSATCCSMSATTPAAESPSDATTRPQTRSWTWQKTFSHPWVMLVSTECLRLEKAAGESQFKMLSIKVVWCLLSLSKCLLTRTEK